MPLPREAKCGGCGPESSDLCRATRLAQPHTLTQVSELCFSASALSTAPTHPCRPSPTQLMLDGCVGGVYLSTVLSDSIFLCGPEVSQVGGAEAGRWYHLCGNQPKEMRLSENDGESSNPLPAFSLQLSAARTQTCFVPGSVRCTRDTTTRSLGSGEESVKRDNDH